MTADVHFVQGGDEPILAGAGSETLACPCGHKLITGYDPLRVLGIGLRCSRCGTVTTTPRLPAGIMLPRALITAEVSDEPRMVAMTVPAHVAVVGRMEMDRLGTLFRPVTPADTTYQITSGLLDRIEAMYDRHLGRTLPEAGADHALAMAVAHLRQRLLGGPWACTEDAATANAVLHVTGFEHFVAAWSHHPLFPDMVATADSQGFSLHALALFAGAHALTMMGNRIGFQTPLGYPVRIDRFDLAVGGAEVVTVWLKAVAGDQARLGTVVSDVASSVQARINLRNPGLLLLSPGGSVPGFDEALIAAMKTVVPLVGRKNQGLMAVASIALRMQPMPDPHTIRLGYGLFPVHNQHYSGPR